MSRNCADEDGGEGGGAGGGGYTEEERKVLSATTTINGTQYLPFIVADLRLGYWCFYTDIKSKKCTNF